MAIWVYLGRNDNQVKIRGFRIELGEIEARLCDHLSVAEAVVVAIGEEMNKRLVAYVITRHHEPHGERTDARTSHLATTLGSHLVKCLPEYMIPAAFMRMDEFRSMLTESLIDALYQFQTVRHSLEKRTRKRKERSSSRLHPFGQTC